MCFKNTFVVILLACIRLIKTEDVFLKIKQGQIKGFTDTAFNNDTFYSYLGIPFAKPIFGILRFRPPENAEPWEGVFDATRPGDCCPQPKGARLPQKCSDNCLHLNVFTKWNPASNLGLDENSKNLSSVLVWIHGGGFLTGSNSPVLYGGQFLLTEDIVLVTINYRLGFYGFAQLEDTSLGITGNAGIKDQIAALKWVQNNIASFGGNPKDVTIMGGSAGGASTHALMLTPLAKNLFHKSIVQDGCALNIWSQAITTTKLFHNFTNEFINDAEILRHLENLSNDKIVELEEFFASNVTYETKRASFGLQIEKDDVRMEDRVFPKDIIDLIRLGEINDVPMLIGHNINEGMVVNMIFEVPKADWGKIQQMPDIEDYVPFQLGYVFGSNENKKVAKEIIDHYYKSPNDINFNLMSDLFFKHGIHATVKTHQKLSNHSIYYYLFTAETNLNFLKTISSDFRDVPGSLHYDEIGYLFNSILTIEYKDFNQVEKNVLEKIIKLWTNFIKTGNPTPDDSNDTLKLPKWEPVTCDTIKVINISNTELQMIEEAEKTDLDFWDQIYAASPNGKKYVSND